MKPDDYILVQPPENEDPHPDLTVGSMSAYNCMRMVWDIVVAVLFFLCRSLPTTAGSFLMND
jgi:hypothetical protein